VLESKQKLLPKVWQKVISHTLKPSLFLINHHI